MLNLQATERRSTGIHSLNGSEVASVAFNGALGSLGASFELGGEDEPECPETQDWELGESTSVQRGGGHACEDLVMR